MSKSMQSNPRMSARTVLFKLCEPAVLILCVASVVGSSSVLTLAKDADGQEPQNVVVATTSGTEVPIPAAGSIESTQTGNRQSEARQQSGPQQGDNKQGGRQGGNKKGTIKPDENKQEDNKQGGNKQGGSGLGGYEKPPPANDVPTQDFNLLLGRPTDNSVTLRVWTSTAGIGWVEYGRNSNELAKTDKLAFRPDQPQDIVLRGLTSNTRYSYRFIWAPKDDATHVTSEMLSFHTQRSPGANFSFTVTADSHLDENSNGQVYLRTLTNALADQPDFHFELGDTFMTGKYVKPEYSQGQYLAQRYYLGHLCHSVPLFFALGNHDGESANRSSMRWATQTRKRYFPNPEPNQFYSGNQQREPELGFPEDYYAWNWGDAQFIVLDPFRYTTQLRRNGREGSSNQNPVQGNWHWTLGHEQYKWLKACLESCTPKYRFVFLHHLVGGAVPHSRGGAEVASLWEWGGKNEDGQYQFDQFRPGWELPIHQLLRKHGVSAVFHGHDHLFAKQEYDGIIYQEVPQPSHARVGNTRTAAEYGYLSGEIQSSSGHVRVRIQSDVAQVDYVRAYLAKDENSSRSNAQVSYSYQIQPSTQNKGKSK